MEVSPKQWQLLTSPADFVVFGGAAGGGKSWCVSVDMLRHCQGAHANPDFRGVLFRKTYPQLTQPGGLLDITRSIYTQFGAIFNETRSEWRFPCGAKISLKTLQYEKDIEQYLGSQFDAIAIDEANSFTLKNIMFLWSRCRSKSGVRPVLRLTTNPDHDSFLYKMVFNWIDPDTGYPIPEKSGVISHFIIDNDQFLWFDEPQFDSEGNKTSTSMTFIPAKLDDNAHLLKSDPAYRQRLLSLPTQERERFLSGCWLASSKGDTEWPRECFLGLYCTPDQFPVPSGRNVVRMFAIDASKGKHEKSGDYSAIVCLAQTSDLKYVDADLARRPPSQIVEDLFLFCENPLHRIRSGDMLGIETLQFQELFRDMIYLYAKAHPEYALSKFLLAGNPIIQVEDMLKKQMRIRRLDTHIRNREFRFLQNPGTTLLLQQLKQFDGIPGKGKHDDGPDSLDMANQLPRHLELMYERQRKGR